MLSQVHLFVHNDVLKFYTIIVKPEPPNQKSYVLAMSLRNASEHGHILNVNQNLSNIMCKESICIKAKEGR